MTKKDENQNSETDGSNSKTIAFIVLVYCMSGTSLALANKLAIVAFPYANILVALQNGMIVIILGAGSHSFRPTLDPLPALSMDMIQLWILSVVSFVAMLSSNLLALFYVSLPTLIVMRNLSTLLIAILESIALRQPINAVSIVTFGGMSFGAIVYARHDVTFSIIGYAWLAALVVGTSVHQIAAKKMMESPLMRSMGPISITYYLNLMSLPLLVIVAFAMGEIPALMSHTHAGFLVSRYSISIILLTCIFTFLSAVSTSALNKPVSKTLITFANDTNQCSIIIFSEALFRSTLTFVTATGAMFVLLFSWLHLQTGKSFIRVCSVVAIITFVVLSGTLEYSNRANKAIFTIRNSGESNIYQSFFPHFTGRQKAHRWPPGIMP